MGAYVSEKNEPIVNYYRLIYLTGLSLPPSYYCSSLEGLLTLEILLLLSQSEVPLFRTVPMHPSLSMMKSYQSPFQSPYRVDVYYDDPDDDDEYGSLISTLEKNEQYGINSYVGHTFFVTPHGMKHRLFVNGERLSFNVGQRDQEFRVPRDAYSEDWSKDDEEDSEDHTEYSEKKEWVTTRAAQQVDRFWRHIQEEQAGLDDGHGEHFQDVQQCIQNLLSKDDMRRLEEQTTPLIVDTLEDTESRTYRSCRDC